MKVGVFGNTASGKSYLAGQIAQRLDLALVELDKIYWQKNWTHLSQAEFLDKQLEILSADNWILDGTFSECGLAERFAASDRLILLDSKPLNCLKRAIRRIGSETERLADGSDDRQLGLLRSLKFAAEILTFNLRDRRAILKMAGKFSGKLLIIKSWTEEEDLLERLTLILKEGNKNGLI